MVLREGDVRGCWRSRFRRGTISLYHHGIIIQQIHHYVSNIVNGR